MTNPKKIRLLIVDDIFETQENIRRLVSFSPEIEVIGTAENGREAIEKAIKTRPDVILMDVNMPDMDGITATEVIRRKSPLSMVIILSVQADQNYMRRAMMAGAVDYITKPPSIDELITAIQRAATRNENKGLLILNKKQDLIISLSNLAERQYLYENKLLTANLLNQFELLISGIAHDLRSPINIIFTILTNCNTNNEETQLQLKNLLRKCLVSKWIVDRFLGISISEKMQIQEIDLRKIINEVTNILSDEISTSIHINSGIPENFAVCVDEKLLKIILLNLLINAIENFPNKGTIEINALQENHKFLITIEDSGKPISSHYLNQIFDLGFSTKKYHAGIGLYVAKRLAQLQQGDVYYYQHKKNKVFGIRLPIIKNSYGTVTEYEISRLEIKKAILLKELEKLKQTTSTIAQQAEIETEFKRLTSSFSHTLSRELSDLKKLAEQTTINLNDDEKHLAAPLSKVIKNCTYCQLLTNNILEIGKGTNSKYANISLIDVIETVLSLIDRKMPQDLFQVCWDIDPTLGDIQADSVQLMQVFMNLIRNALDAMQHGGTLSIRITRKNEYALIEVSDTGIGIAPSQLSELFTLGYTTKSKGYGIGLYSIKNIITRHGGKIDVESIPGQGTTFSILLPITQKKEGASNE